MAITTIKFTCDNCGGPGEDRPYEYRRKKRHFCCRKCYTEFRATKLPREENNAWQGGISSSSKARYYQSNKSKILAYIRRRRELEKNAPGHHTLAQWEEIKSRYNNQCSDKDDTCSGPITKDHIIPLTMGGSNDPSNLQPLCKSHNSRKWRKIHLRQFDPDAER